MPLLSESILSTRNKAGSTVMTLAAPQRRGLTQSCHYTFMFLTVFNTFSPARVSEGRDFILSTVLVC